MVKHYQKLKRSSYWASNLSNESFLTKKSCFSQSWANDNEVFQHFCDFDLNFQRFWGIYWPNIKSIGVSRSKRGLYLKVQFNHYIYLVGLTLVRKIQLLKPNCHIFYILFLTLPNYWVTFEKIYSCDLYKYA